ncbi:MAG TPA: ATP-binding cassette domain-containing protein [Spirochaetota bacterium]|nr:ATP-binding cassette domain-containing protein [Spirochaetota bacterium]
MNNAIEVTSLSKSFNKKASPAVHDISFSIKQGEVCGILGINGAGKTTLLRMIATILRPTSGSCSVLGYDVVKESAEIRSKTGVLFGADSGLYERLTGRENILYFAEMNGIPRDTAATQLHKISSLLSMESYLDARCRTYSHGMKQKTALTRSIIHNPPVLLLDEPVTGLDIHASQVIYSLIRKWKDEQKTVLYSGHDISAIASFCDSIIMIHGGMMIESGSPESIQNRYSRPLQDVFLHLTGGTI